MLVLAKGPTDPFISHVTRSQANALSFMIPNYKTGMKIPSLGGCSKY